MLKLVVYPGAFQEPSASPFCVKAMCLLKMADLAHEIEETNDPRKAPKRKLPVLVNGSAVIADSDQIRDYLEETSGFDFDAGLNAEQRAVSRAVIRMLEEHLYFALVCDRWGNDANWAHTKRAYFSHIPFPMNGLVTRMVRKQALGAMDGQGMGRHSDAERFERVRKDIDAVADLLGDKPFLFGEAPKAADVTAVTMLGAGAAAPVPTDTSRYIAGHDTLSAYIERGRQALYPQA